MLIVKYNDFLLFEKYDTNLIKQFKKLGVSDKSDLNELIYHSHNGNLGKYLEKNDKKFTFGILHAIFLDAIEAKRKSDLKVGIIKAIHRITPTLLAPFFPVIAIIGAVFSTTRTFNKVITPILNDPGRDYPEFLTKIIKSSMRLAEGEFSPKDRFSRAFVVNDNLVSALRENVLIDFSKYLANKMSNEDSFKEVPDHYIENELKDYINNRFKVYPKIPLRK